MSQSPLATYLSEIKARLDLFHYDDGYKDKLASDMATDIARLLAALEKCVEALEYIQPRIAGLSHTCLPINVRELDGSVSQVRPISGAGEAYNKINETNAELSHILKPEGEK